MYRICTTEDAATRQRQLEAQLRREMGTRRLEQITAAELCAPLGISRRAFYHYFSGKEDALTALLDHTLQEYAVFECPQDPGRPTHFSELKRFVVFWQQQKELLDALHHNHLEHKLAERTLALLATEGSAMRCSLWLTDTEYREQLRRVIVDGVYSVIFGWYKAGFRQAPDQVTELLCHILLEPLVV